MARKSYYGYVEKNRKIRKISKNRYKQKYDKRSYKRSTHAKRDRPLVIYQEMFPRFRRYI